MAGTIQQTPGYVGIIIIGGMQIPCFSASLVAPENDYNPPIIGNYFESYNWAPGLINPVVQFDLAVRDTTAECLSNTFLEWFFGRTSAPSHDTNIVSEGVKFWDGRSGFQLNGVKADTLSLSFTKGGGIRLSARFCASNAEGTDALVALGSAPSFTAWDATPLLYGPAVTWSPFNTCIWSGDIQLSNNHRTDDCMNGSRYPQQQNASQQTVGFTMTRRAAAAAPSDGDPVTVTITGSAFTRTFTILNPLYQTVKNRNITLPETFRTYAAKCLGTAGNNAAISYGGTGF